MTVLTLCWLLALCHLVGLLAALALAYRLVVKTGDPTVPVHLAVLVSAFMSPLPLGQIRRAAGALAMRVFRRKRAMLRTYGRSRRGDMNRRTFQRMV